MTPAILTIAYVIVVCAIVWLGHRHELAVHAAEQRERDRKADVLRRGGEVDFVQSHSEGVTE